MFRKLKLDFDFNFDLRGHDRTVGLPLASALNL